MTAIERWQRMTHPTEVGDWSLGVKLEELMATPEGAEIVRMEIAPYLTLSPAPARMAGSYAVVEATTTIPRINGMPQNPAGVALRLNLREKLDRAIYEGLIDANGNPHVIRAKPHA